MDEYLIQGSTLADIADAIREKTGDDSLMTPAEMVTAIGNISGGGVDSGVEWTADANGNLIKAKIIGDTVPPCAFSYGFYSAQNAVTIDLTGVKTIGDYAFAYSNRCLIDFSTVGDVEVCGAASFRFPAASINSMSGQTASFQKLTGVNSGNGIFRGANDYYPKTWTFPVMSSIPSLIFYGASILNVSVTIGSIGYAVNQTGDRPFGGTTNATGTITIYTTGSFLDTIKTGIQNGAGSGLQFVYKASEATEYGGVSYAAGDTMLTN